MTSSIESWALPRLQQLLPIDDDSARQVITYTNSLPKDEAAEHLKNLLGDDAKSLEFISSFNVRRQNAPASSSSGASHARSNVTPAQNPERPPKSRGPKKKPNIHTLPARQLQDRGNVQGAYQKRDEEDYMPGASRAQKHKEIIADNLALRQTPDAVKLPLITDDARLTNKPINAKPPPSAAGALISDALEAPARKSGQSSSATSRTSSPAPKTKVNITGGTAMHGASTALSDLDSAIRSLEIQTNPSLTSTSAEDEARRKCNCMATRHPLLDIAPNCTNCGKIICVKEGLGPCTFCHTPLLDAEDIQKVLRVLKDERGEERMKVNNASHKKAEVAQGKARAFTGRDFLAQASSSPKKSPLAAQDVSADASAQAAQAHRDKLLTFQANNARRTQVHDEAADYDVPTAGTNMWASPQERAQQLKRQQKALREMEWNARPDYEKRRVVASIDLKGGKVVRRMAEIEKPDFTSPDDDDDDDDDEHHAPSLPPAAAPSAPHSAFSNNPLAKGLIKPTARVPATTTASKHAAALPDKKQAWRRVQMDEDNEQWILDGGVYGGRPDANPTLGSEEPACG